MANDVLARLAVQIDAKTQQFGAALNVLNGQLNKFGTTVQAQTNSISNFEKRIAGIQRTLGSLGVAFGAFQLANIFKDSVQRIAAFEKQIDTVGAIAGATGAELEKLRQDALRLGSTSQFTATEVAKLQTEFARLGFSTKEILSATEAVIDLATATGEDLAKSADVAGSTVRAFGLSADETQRVVDVMAEAFNRSALGVDNFADSMKFVAPIAKAAGISIEETSALLGVLADAGIRGSTAGTSLRRIITDLAKDGRPLVERLKELAAGGLTFGGAMDEVGRLAQTSLLILTDNVDRIDSFTEGLNNAAGAAKATAAVMRDNLAGDIEKLTRAYDGFILSLDKSDGSIREVVQGLTQLVEVITRISNSGFGEFVADWFRLTQIVPRFVLGALDLFATWGDEIEITKDEAGKLFFELNRLKQTAELEGKAKLAQEYADKIQQLTDRFGDLGREAGIVGPQLQQIIDPRIIAGMGKVLEPAVGIIETLEARAKSLGEAIKTATSISEIRQLQRELEGVQIRIKSILDPSVAPKPIVIPIEFAEPDLSIQEFSDRILALGQKVVIPVELEIPTDTEDTGLTAQLEAMSDQLRAFSESAAEIIRNGIGNALVALGEDFGNLATGVGAFGDNVLKAFADFAGQFGKLMIATAVAKIKFDTLLATPGGGFILAAAGVALVAAAKAVSNHLSNASSFGAGGAGGGSGGGGSSRSPADFVRERAGEQIQFVQGEFKVRGQDLVVVLDNTTRRNSRTG